MCDNIDINWDVSHIMCDISDKSCGVSGCVENSDKENCHTFDVNVDDDVRGVSDIADVHVRDDPKENEGKKYTERDKSHGLESTVDITESGVNNASKNINDGDGDEVDHIIEECFSDYLDIINDDLLREEVGIPSNVHKGECQNTSLQMHQVPQDTIPQDVPKTDGKPKRKIRIRRHRVKNRNCLCSICGKLLYTYQMESHYASHLNKKLFECTICKYRFTSKVSLHGHMEIHENTPNKYKCEYPHCQKAFARKNYLRTHVTRVHQKKNKKRSACSVCLKRFENREVMLAHKSWHDPNDGPKCRICFKVCSSSSVRLVHEKQHRNEKFSCKICHKQFKYPAALSAHNRVHTGELPYKCPKCSLAFSQHYSRVRHLKTHRESEKLLNCDLCDNIYRSKRDMNKHMKLHKTTGSEAREVLLKCPVCALQYRTTRGLRAHYQAMHDMTLDEEETESENVVVVASLSTNEGPDGQNTCQTIVSKYDELQSCAREHNSPDEDESSSGELRQSSNGTLNDGLAGEDACSSLGGGKSTGIPRCLNPESNSRNTHSEERPDRPRRTITQSVPNYNFSIDDSSNDEFVSLSDVSDQAYEPYEDFEEKSDVEYLEDNHPIIATEHLEYNKSKNKPLHLRKEFVKEVSTSGSVKDNITGNVDDNATSEPQKEDMTSASDARQQDYDITTDECNDEMETVRSPSPGSLKGNDSGFACNDDDIATSKHTEDEMTIITDSLQQDGDIKTEETVRSRSPGNLKGNGLGFTCNDDIATSEPTEGEMTIITDWRQKDNNIKTDDHRHELETARSHSSGIPRISNIIVRSLNRRSKTAKLVLHKLSSEKYRNGAILIKADDNLDGQRARIVPRSDGLQCLRLVY